MGAGRPAPRATKRGRTMTTTTKVPQMTTSMSDCLDVFFEAFGGNGKPLKTKKQDLSHFPLNEIQPAPENALLYDSFAPSVDEDDFILCESIRVNGIREPLHISADDFLLSGHRRYAAARCLGLKVVPVLVADDVVFADLSDDERLAVLALYNRQRDKSYAERLREAIIEVDPDVAYDRLVRDRVKSFQVAVEDNINVGEYRGRKRITTLGFLRAVQKVVYAEREYWPLTVRRIHYLLLNDPPLRHDRKPGSTYQNTMSCYKATTNLCLRARLTGDIPHAAIEDDTRPILDLAVYQNPADYIKEETQGFLRHYTRDLLRGQVNHLEILLEKNGLRKHVEKVAVEYCVPCSTGLGFSSLTPRLKMVQRFKRSGKGQLILLVLSDFDPDGEEIAASFPRSLRDDFGLRGVIAHKVAISGDDVREHGLPSNLEAKILSKNYKKFVAKHGVTVAELDAAPVALLQSKLRDAIESCLDMNLFRAEVAKEKEDYVFVAATKQVVLKAMRA